MRGIPLYFGYTQLMMWDLFKESSPIRDINFNPEVYYRLELSQEKGSEDRLDLGFFEHESNGKDGLDSRSWNRVFLRYFSHLRADDQRFGWSLKLALPYSMGDDGSRRLPERRGIWELELRASDLFNRLFEVNEIIFRVYGGGAGRVNPLRGGQELTYREKGSSRAILLPLYIQIFHGYGENLLNADENRWGIRGGFGF